MNKMNKRTLAVAILSLLGAAGCELIVDFDRSLIDGGSDTTDATFPDSPPGDTSALDMGLVDSSGQDTSVLDTGAADTNVADTNLPDTNVADTSVADASDSG